MGLENVQESKAFVAVEMFIRQEIDNDVDDYVLLEDGQFLKLEDDSAIYKEF